MVLISVITPRAEGTKVLPELKKRENKQLHERVQGEGPGNLKTPFSSDAFHWLNSVWNFRARKSVDACSLCGLAPRPQSRVEETKDWKQMEDIQYKHLLLYSPGLFAIGYHSLNPCAFAKILHTPNVTSSGKSSGISFSLFEHEAWCSETMRVRKRSKWANLWGQVVTFSNWHNFWRKEKDLKKAKSVSQFSQPSWDGKTSGCMSAGLDTDVSVTVINTWVCLWVKQWFQQSHGAFGKV